MTDDSLTNTLGLRPRRPPSLQFLQRLKAAVPLETQVRGGAVLLRRRHVVVQTGEGPGFEESFADGLGGDPGGEVLRYDRVAVGVDAQAVVVGAAREEGVDVFLGGLHEVRGGEDFGYVDGGGGRFGGGRAGDGASVAWFGGPAVFFGV